MNCVCLDEEPQCRCYRLLVAAHVSLSQTGNDMQLRQTTMMPKIPGLPAIVAMLFAPKAELRYVNSTPVISLAVITVSVKPDIPTDTFVGRLKQNSHLQLLDCLHMSPWALCPICYSEVG